MCSGTCVHERLCYLDDGNSSSDSAYYPKVLFEQVSDRGLAGLYVWTMGENYESPFNINGIMIICVIYCQLKFFNEL